MKKLIALFSLLFITSCGAVDVTTSVQKMPVVSAPPISPMNMRYVEFGTCKMDNNEYVYSLTPSNFGNLNNNIIEMRRYILSIRARSDFYENLSKSVEVQPTVKK